MSYIFPLLTGICLSACTGFRAFLPPFLLGLFHRLFPNHVLLPSNLIFLAQDPALIALGVAVFVEFLGDKIPWVDHTLDVLNLPVKMAIGTILTFSLLPPGEYTWFYVLIAIVFGGGTSTVVHSGKATLRVSSTATTAGTFNPLISIVEEGVSFVGTVLTLFLPLVAGLALLVLIFFGVRAILKRSHEKQIREIQPSCAFFNFARITTNIFFSVYNRFRVEGREFLPASGPFVVVGNHSSMIDGFLLGIAVGRPVFIMVKQEAFRNPFTNWFLRKALSFPVDRDNPDPSAIRKAFRTLKDGNILGIFPEGTRNRAGLMRPFKPGAIRVAIKQKIPIIPIYFYNSHAFSPENSWFPRPVRMIAKFGSPLDISEMLSQGKTEDEIQSILYEKVCDLGYNVAGKDIRDHSLETAHST